MCACLRTPTKRTRYFLPNTFDEKNTTTILQFIKIAVSLSTSHSLFSHYIRVICSLLHLASHISLLTSQHSMFVCSIDQPHSSLASGTTRDRRAHRRYNASLNDSTDSILPRERHIMSRRCIANIGSGNKQQFLQVSSVNCHHSKIIR